MKQFLKVLCFTAFFIMLSGTYYCKADTLDLVENILMPTEMTDFYIYNLNPVQQEIASYLVGCYNSVYLGSRGFFATDNTFNDSNVYFATMKMYGNKIFNYINSVASRFDETLSQYISSCLIYAYQQNYNSFQDWYNNLDETFYIPYSESALNSWDRFYNDNSISGIKSFGDQVSDWHSGDLYEVDQSIINNFSSQGLSDFNAWVLNNSPVICTNVGAYWIGNRPVQDIYGGFDDDLPDTLVLQRGGNNQYRYGRFVKLVNGNEFHVYQGDMNKCHLDSGNSTASYQYNFVPDSTSLKGTLDYGYLTDLQSIIDRFFLMTPIKYDTSNGFMGYYPYILHVFLVDDLSTFSNPLEIHNATYYEIDSTSDIVYVPKGEFKLNVNVDMPDNNTYIKYIVINSVDDNNEPVNDDDFIPNPVILNNPVNDSYYKPYSPTSPLPSFDIGLFGDAGGQIAYFKECAEKFIIYTRQVLDCFSFNDGEEGPALIIVAVLIIGIAGGLVVKMLL